MDDECLSHLDHAGKVCPGCQEPVDEHGNTAYDFNYCAFPNCGCDGARLCMAREGASQLAGRCNVEGMWSGKTTEQRKGVFDLLEHIRDNK